jgi:hypothetical protein
MTQARRVRLSAMQRTDMWSRWKAGQCSTVPGSTRGGIGRDSTPIRSWVWDLQFTSIERENERTLHGWIADLLPRTELEVIARRGDRT